MGDGQDNTTGFESIIADWMAGASHLSELWRKTWMDTARDFSSVSMGKKNKKKTPQEEALESFLQSFEIISHAFSEPDSIAVLLKGTDILPGLTLKMARAVFDGYASFQKHWMGKAARIGTATQAYQFEQLDLDIFKTWNELYDKEFKPFFNIPQLGLNRFYLEHLHQAQDAFNIFQSKLAKFVFTLFLPVEKSFKVLNAELEEKSKKGELPDNSGDLYRLWIKILEGHYMRLFQSEQYTEVLNDTLNAMTEFRRRREIVINDVLKDFAIPTHTELDGLYRELYETKKRLRALEKKMKDQD